MSSTTPYRMPMAVLGLVVCLCLVPVSVQADAIADPAARDPWQGLNRRIYAFNDGFDRYLARPVARGYQWLLPQPVETGIGNFFGNLKEVRTILNQLLQGKPLAAASDAGRLLINSTLGVAGFLDVATHLGLAAHDEDFGQTLGYWGLPSGPYLVLPFLGPSTLRDTAGLGLDTAVHPISHVDHVPTRNSVSGTDMVNRRAALLKAEDLVFGDRYEFIRDTYLQRRDYLVRDGAIEDDFGGDFDDFF